MAQSSNICRQIVEEQDFLDHLPGVFGSIRGGDESVVDALKWQLAREPDFSGFPAIKITPLGLLRAITSEGTKEWPEVVIFFVAHREKVILCDLMVSPQATLDDEDVVIEAEITGLETGTDPKPPSRQD